MHGKSGFYCIIKWIYNKIFYKTDVGRGLEKVPGLATNINKYFNEKIKIKMAGSSHSLHLNFVL